MNLRMAMNFLIVSLPMGYLRLYSWMTPLGLSSWPTMGVIMKLLMFLYDLMLSVSG